MARRIIQLDDGRFAAEYAQSDIRMRLTMHQILDLAKTEHVLSAKGKVVFVFFVGAEEE